MSYGARYASEKNALGICERCAEKVPLRALRPDGQYPELRVCADCWDPKHPQEFLPPTFDPVSLRDPTGDPERVQANIITIRDLRPVVSAPVDYWGDGDEPGTSNFDDVQIGGASMYAADVQLEAFSQLSINVQVNKTKFNLVSGGSGSITDPEPPIPGPNLDNSGGIYDDLFTDSSSAPATTILRVDKDGTVQFDDGFVSVVNFTTDWIAQADRPQDGADYEARLDVLTGPDPDGDAVGTWLNLANDAEWSRSVTGAETVGGDVRLRVRRADGTGETSVDFTFSLLGF